MAFWVNSLKICGYETCIPKTAKSNIIFSLSLSSSSSSSIIWFIRLKVFKYLLRLLGLLPIVYRIIFVIWLIFPLSRGTPKASSFVFKKEVMSYAPTGMVNGTCIILSKKDLNSLSFSFVFGPNLPSNPFTTTS